MNFCKTGVDKSETAGEETGVNSFDRRVIDTRGPQGRVDEVVEQRDHHNDGDGVNVATRKNNVS